MKPVKIENNVESWLSSLLKMLQYSVQSNVASAAADVADEQLRILDCLQTNLVQVTLVKCSVPSTCTVLECMKITKKGKRTCKDLQDT